jgi:antitoxin component YwqK of YwqJK toxin-antitoxin module
MKNIFFHKFLIVVLVLFSCSMEQFEDIAMLEINNGLFYLKSTGQLYSGMAVASFKDGQRKYVQSFRNGVLSGLVKTWHPNGKIRSEEHYNNNLISGKNIYFHESGEIKLEINIADSLLEGTFHYQEDDYIYSAFFSNGKLTRSEIQYQLADNIIIQTYANSMLFTSEFTKENEIIETTQKTYIDKTNASAFLDNGILVVSFNEEGQLAGRLFFKNGDIVLQENYVNGQLDILLYHDREAGNRIYHCYYQGSALESDSDDICSNLPVFTNPL